MNIKSKTNKNILSAIKTNVTKDVFFTLVNSLWRIISGPVTLIFIPLFLTPQIQGFWYTFISLAALTVFADLGFTTIVTQFSAHEYAVIGFNEQTGLFEGEEINIKRIGSLFRFVINWALTVGAIGFPVILTVGMVMFSNKSTQVHWVIPWCIYVISSGLSFTVGSLLSFFEGCGQIAAIEKNKFIGAIASTILMMSSLYLGFGLYALAFTSIIVALINIGLLYIRFGKLITQLFKTSKGFHVNWRSDFLKLIWKYAISWSSGYFIFQIYTPLMFRFHGPIEAGKVGISIALTTAVFSISNVWIYVANPKLNMFVSSRQWQQMDRLILKSILLSVVTFSTGAIFVLLAIHFYAGSFKFLNRFIGIISLSILFGAWLIQIIINGLAVYLRAHKQEPLVALSLLMAIYIGVSTLLITRYLLPQYLFLGYLTAAIWGLPVTCWIFIKKRKEWHT